MVTRITLIFLLAISPIVLISQELSVGAKFQKTVNMYWENGISLQYSFKNFAPKKFAIGLDYVTSRLGSAINSNAIKQDNYSVTLSWDFLTEKPLSIYGRLNLGNFYANLEEEIFSDLPSTTFFIAPELTFAYRFSEYPIALQTGCGYKVDFKEDGYSPGTFQPLYFHFDVFYVFQFQSKDE